LQRVEPALARETLDRDDLRAVRLQREDEARIHAATVEEHRARAALADEAALLRAGEPEVRPEHVEQGPVRCDRRAALAPVDRQRERNVRGCFGQIHRRHLEVAAASRSRAMAAARNASTWSIASRY